MGFCSKRFKNEFETAVVNEPSVFVPLKFYCIISSNEQKKIDICPQYAVSDLFLLFYLLMDFNLFFSHMFKRCVARKT